VLSVTVTELFGAGLTVLAFVVAMLQSFRFIKPARQADGIG